MDEIFCVWKLKRQDTPHSEPIVLPRGITTVGRGLNNSLRCPSTLASRNHCEIKLLDSGLIFIKDLKSLNGTFLDSAKILPERYISLSHGDIIGIGVETTDIENGAVCIFHLTQNVLDKDELKSRRGDMCIVPRNGLPCDDDFTSYKHCVTGKKTDNDIDGCSNAIVLSPGSNILVNQTHLNINQDHGLTITSDCMGNKTKINPSLTKEVVSQQQSNVHILKTVSDNLNISIAQQSKTDNPLISAKQNLTKTEIYRHSQPQSTFCVDTQTHENRSSSKTNQSIQCSEAKLIESDTGVDPDYEINITLQNVISELEKLEQNNTSSTNPLNSTIMPTPTPSFLSPLHTQDLTANCTSIVTKNTINYNLPVDKLSLSESPKVKETGDAAISNECFSAGKKEIGSYRCALEQTRPDKSGTVSNKQKNTNDLVDSIKQRLCSVQNQNLSEIDETVNSIFKRRLSHDTPNHKNPPEITNMTSSGLERCNVDSISLDCGEKLLHPKKVDKKRMSKSIDDQDIFNLTGKVQSSVSESFTIDDDIIIIDDDDLLPCSQMFDIKIETIENTVEDSDIPVVDITDEDDISEADSSDEWFLRLSQCEPLNEDTLEDDYDLDSENNQLDSCKSNVKESNVLERIFNVEEKTVSEDSINQIPLELNMDVTTSEEFKHENKIEENNHAVNEKFQKADACLEPNSSVDSNLNNTCSYGPYSTNKRKHDSSELSANLTTVNHLENQHVESKKMKQTHSNDVTSPANNIADDLNKIAIKHDLVDQSLPYCDHKSGRLDKVQDVDLREPTTGPHKPAWKYIIEELLIISNNWDASKGCAKTPCDVGDQKSIAVNKSIQLKETHNFKGQEHFESTCSKTSLSVSNDLSTKTSRETIQICNETLEESKFFNKTLNDFNSYKIKKHSDCSSKLSSIQETKLDSIQKKISDKYRKQPTPVVGAKALPSKNSGRLSKDPILNKSTKIPHNESKPWLSKGVAHKGNNFSLTADKKAHRKSKLSEIASKANVQESTNTKQKIVKPPKNSIKITRKNRTEMFLDHLVSKGRSSKEEESANVNVESKQKNSLLQFKIPRRNVIKDDKIESKTLNDEDGSKQCLTMSVAESGIMKTVKVSEIQHVTYHQPNMDLSKTEGSVNCDINELPACKNTDTTSDLTTTQNLQPHPGLDYDANDQRHHIKSVIGPLKPIIKLPNSTLNNKIKQTVRFCHGEENKLIVNIRSFDIEDGSSLKPITRFIAKKDTPPQRQDLNHALQMPFSNYFEELLYQICKWNTVWFQEKNNVKGEPPVCMEQVYHLKDSFISYSDYRRSFCPLMLYELWASMARHHDQIQNGNRPFTIDIQRMSNKRVTTMFFLDQKGGEKNTLCRLDCQILFDKSNQSLCPRTCDLAVLDVKTKSPIGEQSFTSRILGYIFFCNMRAISSHSAISPKLKAKVVNPTLVMDLSMYIRYKCKIDTTQESRIAVLKNIRSEMRLFNALDCLATSPMLGIICQPGINNSEIPLRLSIEKSTRQTIDHLNESQIKAVNNVTSACLTNMDTIHFIHGPPGCGKSEVIISIIQMIFLAHIRKELTEPPQILLCAPSNAAIDDIFLRLMEYRNKYKKSFKNQTIKMVRVGRTDVTHKNVRSMTLDFLVDKDLKKRRDIMEDEESRQIELKILEAKRNQLSYQLENLRLERNDATYKRNVEIKLAETIKSIKTLEKGASQKAFEGKELREKKKERELLFLGGANVIASTLSSCYNAQMEAAQANKKLRFTCCIVDEATQCTEPDLLIPLMLGVRHLVLVGDPLQLPATVLSSTAKEHGLDRSLFARHRDWWLRNNTDGSPTPRYHFLDTQYRMHPDIAKWPSQYFYSSSIKNHDSVESRGSSHPLLPYVILSHSFTQRNHEECNYEEVTLIELLVKAINESGLCKHRTIGVITPYSRQRDLLRRKLAADIDVGTVDSFQGRERDIMIMSCVRTEGVGFMSGTERLNVALTRARYSLIICGNFKSLQKDPTWASLLQDAMVRGTLKTVVTSYRSQDLFEAISKSK